MKRAEKIARARELRDQGLSYPEVARRLGVAKKTVRRWLNPDEAERDRASSRAFKEANRDRMHAYDRQYGHEHRGTCHTCGGEMGAKTKDGVCSDCRGFEAAVKAVRVERLWNEGKSFREVAAAMGWSRDHLANAMDKYREQGYDLPYRYELSNPKFPEQVAA